MHQGKLYIYGGYDINEGLLNNLWCLNVDNLKCLQDMKRRQNAQGQTAIGVDSMDVDLNFGWEKIETTVKGQRLEQRDQFGSKQTYGNRNEPGALAYHSGLVAGDYMYLYGGSSAVHENRSLFRLNLIKMEWEKVTERFTTKGGKFPIREGHAACMTNDRRNPLMYIFGGFNASMSERTNDLHIFSINEQIWQYKVQTSSTSLPSARDGHTGCIYKNHMFIFGGRDQDNTKLNDVWKLNLETLEWKEIQVDYLTRPLERSGHSCDVIG